MATTPADRSVAPQPHEATSLQVLATQSPGVFRLIVVIISGVIGIALLFLGLGWLSQRRARKGTSPLRSSGGVAVEWADVSYFVPNPQERAAPR